MGIMAMGTPMTVPTTKATAIQWYGHDLGA